MRVRRGILAVLLGVSTLLPYTVAAEGPCGATVGSFVSVEGEVEVQYSAGERRVARLDTPLCEGDTIRVGSHSRAAVQLFNHAVLRLDQDTTIRLQDIADTEGEWSWLDIKSGSMESFSRKPTRLRINTKGLEAQIDGTEFVVRSAPSYSSLAVISGRVWVSNATGRVRVPAGAMAFASTDDPDSPLRLHALIAPRELVQWALYYPPVLAADRGQGVSRSNTQIKSTGGIVRQAADLLARGRSEEAMHLLDSLQTDEAQHSSVLALRSIIALTLGQSVSALTYANNAVQSGTDVAGAVALSYAQQATLQLDAALVTLQQARQRFPESALVLTRLAEVYAMLGERDNARVTAEQSLSLDPLSARGHWVLGFTALADFNFNSARQSFQRAIELESADPMGHLGLGLALTGAGNVAEGRRHLEVAVALDTNNALLRTYLGKAYFAEGRSAPSGEQYRLATSIDRNDPTVPLYAAMGLRTENRPLPALRAIQRSIDLNDKRGVYRSRLLVNADQAARGVVLAQTYNDLGFSQLGVNAANRSLAVDPANSEAHRLLADTYLGVRRREIARVSEMLQAQLLQDTNLMPVQPSLSETNLNAYTLGGPALAGFNEFTPLFQRNGVNLNMAAFGGNNATYGGEGVVTAAYDRIALSAGGYEYHSDGWRANNQLEQRVINGFVQVPLTSRLNVQAEFRRRESAEGDLAFNFDPATFESNALRDRAQDTTRIGMRFSPGPASTWLFSYIYSDRRDNLNTNTEIQSQLARVGSSAHQFEGQYIHSWEHANLVAGLGYGHVDLSATNSLVALDIDRTELLRVNEQVKQSTQHPRGYVYSNLRWPDNVTWTLGFSQDSYDEGLISRSLFNPKFGVQLALTPALRLRGAVFRALKPALANNRTIEPTQIAGFNQLFDDINATAFLRYGVGVDWRFGQHVLSGAEISWRDLSEPLLDSSLNGDDSRPKESLVYEDRTERLYRFYLNWASSSRWASSAEFVYDYYASANGIGTARGDLPDKVATYSVPLTLSYFHPCGAYVRLGGTYVDQAVRRAPTSSYASGEDRFFLMDFTIGYRLPRRMGMLNIGVKNLFNSGFKYQDDSFREFRDEASVGPYFPNRLVLMRLALNF